MSKQSSLFATDQHRFEAWKEFHRDNPHVFTLFHKFALEAFLNDKKVGARAIGEQIRWQTEVKTTTAGPKLNDHLWPFYSRLLMAIDDRFKGYFEVRNSRFDATVSEIVQAHKESK